MSDETSAENSDGGLDPAHSCGDGACGAGENVLPVGAGLTEDQWKQMYHAIAALSPGDTGHLIAAASLSYLSKVESSSALISEEPISVMLSIRPTTREVLDGLSDMMNGV